MSPGHPQPRPGDAATCPFPVDALYSPVRQDGQAALSPGQGWTSRGDVYLTIYKVENTRPSTACKAGAQGKLPSERVTVTLYNIDGGEQALGHGDRYAPVPGDLQSAGADGRGDRT